MQEPPAHLGDETVRAAVRAHWGVDARARHLPVGFGAHHWRVGDLFVTFDTLGSRHDAQSLEGAYAAAAELAAQGLEFVLAPVAAGTGRFTVPVADGTLSATPWADAPRAREPADGALLGRLHAARPPAALPQWRPLVGPDLADELASGHGNRGSPDRTERRRGAPCATGWPTSGVGWRPTTATPPEPTPGPG